MQVAHPEGQGLQEEAATPECWPEGQGAQLAVPPAEKVLAVHWVQALEEKPKPASQFEQVLAPVQAEQPDGQVVHEVAPAAEKEPEAHGAQVAEPPAEKVLAAHWVQDPLDRPKPVLQLEQAEALATADPRVTVIRGSFGDIEQIAAAQGILGQIDGVLLDLGVSSPQLDDAERGFSFLRDGPLDMRMDPDSGISAET